MAETSTIAVRIVADSRIERDALAWMLEQVPHLQAVAEFGDDSAEPDARVLVMNDSSAKDDISEFVKAGAAGFVLCDASFDEFVGAIRKVVDLICAGLGNHQIAQRLSIGSNTVKSHVRNILVKLDLHSRLQIAAHTRMVAAGSAGR